MLSIEQINEIESELQMVKQELLLAQNQYNKVVEQNKELQKAYNEISNNSEILHENHCLRIANARLNEDLLQNKVSMREWREQSINYRSALEEINTLAKNYCNACDEFKVKTYKNKKDCLYCNYGFIKRKINEVLNDSEC